MTDQSQEDIATLRKSVRLLAVLLVISVCLTGYGFYRDYSSMKKRVELTVKHRHAYPQLYQSFVEFDACFGDPWLMFATEADWLKCDLTAIQHANRWNQGKTYLQYVVARDKAFLDSGFNMYIQTGWRRLPPPPAS